jgi:hypothetical protein
MPPGRLRIIGSLVSPSDVRSPVEPVPNLSRMWERGALGEGREGLSLQAAQLHTCGHAYRTLTRLAFKILRKTLEPRQEFLIGPQIQEVYG